MKSRALVNSLDEVENLVSEIQKRRIFHTNIMEHFRGQGRDDYKLTPSISRGIIDAKELQIKECKLLEEFETKIRTNKIESILRKDEYLNREKNMWNTLFQAQHLGIPTRLLDWSMKWDVALWFAVENPKDDDTDGQFWVFTAPDKIHVSDSRDCFFNKDLTKLDTTYLINAPIYWSNELPKQIGEVRRQRQYGKFSISPYVASLIPLEEQAEIRPYIEKYIVPAKAKSSIRHDLELKGINKDWLYYRDADNEILEKLDIIIKK